MAMVMTGVPSIVMGLFVYIGRGRCRFGFSAFGGALALACLMLPVVIGTTEQMLRLVPKHLREAAFALGATKARMIFTVVLPAALPGIVSGVAARGGARGRRDRAAAVRRRRGDLVQYRLSSAARTLRCPCRSSATRPPSFVGAQDRAWGAALTLVLLTFLITLIARIVTARFASRK